MADDTTRSKGMRNVGTAADDA